MKELHCRETMTPVEQNKMRPGYDCRCSGCMAWVALHGDPMKKQTYEPPPMWSFGR